jgi:hypothetical protein
LARAAHDFAASNPQFAVEAQLVALPWITAEYGDAITGLDVPAAFSTTGDDRQGLPRAGVADT